MKMPKCPRCGTEITDFIKEWTYGAFQVKKYDCKKCNKSFRAYYHKGELSHIIR